MCRAACRTRNNGYDGRLLRVNTVLFLTLNSACDGRISTAVTRRHPSQNGRYARFTGTGCQGTLVSHSREPFAILALTRIVLWQPVLPSHTGKFPESIRNSIGLQP